MVVTSKIKIKGIESNLSRDVYLMYLGTHFSGNRLEIRNSVAAVKSGRIVKSYVHLSTSPESTFLIPVDVIPIIVNGVAIAPYKPFVITGRNTIEILDMKCEIRVLTKDEIIPDTILPENREAFFKRSWEAQRKMMHYFDRSRDD